MRTLLTILFLAGTALAAINVASSISQAASNVTSAHHSRMSQ
jgi:hypothetical protein